MAEGSWGRQPPLYSSTVVPKRPRPDPVLVYVSCAQFSLTLVIRTCHQCGVDPSATYCSSTWSSWPRSSSLFTMRREACWFPSVIDTKSIGASYDHYLQHQLPSFGSGEASNYAGGGYMHVLESSLVLGGTMHSLPSGDSNISGAGARIVGADMALNDRGMGNGGLPPVDLMVRPGSLGHEMPLPPGASHTLCVEGLPHDATQRVVSHIFRPFLGYKEVRLVTKEPNYNSSDPLVLCFVDFSTPEYAFKALNDLQGYKMDVHDPDSSILRLQFARFPGPSSGYGSSGKR